MQPTTLDELAALEAIRQLKARYCRFVDLKQWERLTLLFTHDATLEGLGSAPDGANAPAFIAGISARLGEVISIHHVHNPEITITGPDTARGIWPMMDYLEFPEGVHPAEAPGARGFVGWGHYEEEYRRENGEWRISYLRLTRMRVDALPADHPHPAFGRHKARPDWI